MTEITKQTISVTEMEALIALVEDGPLHDGKVTSKVSRDALVANHLASKIIYHGEQGYVAATYKGCRLYCELFGNSDTVKEAKAHRIMLHELRSISGR